MRLAKWLTAATVSAAMAVSMVGPAQAHTVAKYDYNDSASPLDLRSTGFLHTRDFYVGGVQTFEVFRNAMLGSKGDAYVDIDSFGTRAADYYVMMSMVDGRLKARVYRYSGSTSYLIGRGTAWRPNGRMVMFAFRRSLIRRAGGYIRFYGETRYQRGVDQYGTVYNWWDRTPFKTHLF